MSKKFKEKMGKRDKQAEKFGVICGLSIPSLVFLDALIPGRDILIEILILIVISFLVFPSSKF